MKIRAGFETTDPRTGTRAVVVAGAAETGGRGWVLEVHCPEGTHASILPHLHERWTETFEILEGDALCRVGREERRLRKGETVVMPPGVAHVHPWNGGTGPMVYRQTDDFGAVTPDAVDDVLGVFATLNGLARERRVDRRGLPRNPLRLAATVRVLVRHGGYDAAIPVSVQKAVAATLGRVAVALGYRGVDERYARADSA